MTYFKLPTNNSIKLDQSFFKLQFKCKNEDTQICSFNLKKYLNKAKKNIDDISYLWNQLKIYTNPYEFIHTNVPNYNISVSKYRPISRAFFKILEIYNLFNLLDYKEPINTFHLAEGPGGFLEATLFLRKNKKDNYYGMTLIDKKDNTPGWKKSKRFLDKFQNISLEYGKDNTGNLYSEKNFNYCCKKYKNKFEIITGDGGIDFSSDFNAQETTAARLILTQVFYAISMQKTNGSFVLKMFDVFNKISVDILYILTLFYKNVHVVKPYTSRYANSEKYIVCVGFINKITVEIKQKFFRILKLLQNIDYNKYSIYSLINVPHSLYFMNYIEDINIVLGQRQIENILYTLKIIKNKEKYQDKINKFKITNIIKSIKWCENNNIETNNFESLINPRNIFLKK